MVLLEYWDMIARRCHLLHLSGYTERIQQFSGQYFIEIAPHKRDKAINDYIFEKEEQYLKDLKLYKQMISITENPRTRMHSKLLNHIATHMMLTRTLATEISIVFKELDTELEIDERLYDP